jgi:signal transduction histidine kinase
MTLRVLLLVAVGAIGAGMVLLSAQAGLMNLTTVLTVLVGWSFVSCGVFLWGRRPDNRLGPLMVLVGSLWLAGRTMQLITNPVVFPVGLWLTDLWAPAFALFLLAFPTGRLRGRLDRAVVGIFLFVTVPLELLWLLFYQPLPGASALAIFADESAALAVDTVQRFVIATGAFLLIGVIGRRWLIGSGPVRRQGIPVVVGALALLLQSGSWILRAFGISLAPLNDLILVAQIAIPVAILAVLIRARMARGAVADLVVELGHTPTPARLRDALASALGDPSLQVAYWSPVEQGFVDGAGTVVDLAALPPTQAVTMLEREGVREAAIVHDAALLEDPGLIASVASAMRLATENDRLTAEVDAQLQEVRASRARIVEAGDAERRRVERDLHDGAQQRLISLSLELRAARSALGEGADPGLRRSLERAADEATAALAELRDLALGIHPLILTESGLAEAVESLADRTTVPVTVEVAPDRYPSAVEAAAYFVISEALVNVTKYAKATRATVRVRLIEDLVRIEIEDDGVGGADPRGGSGLRGLADRLAALDGTIAVDSPAGGGTRITATIPTIAPTVTPVPAR